MLTIFTLKLDTHTGRVYAGAMRIDKEKVKRQMKKRQIRRFAHLAEMLGVRRATLSEWFNGRPFASASLQALVTALDCTPNDVLVWDETQPAHESTG